MTNYTGIQGQNILIVSSDPSDPTEGQIWYNSTSNLLKGYQFAAGAWATGGNLNTARFEPALGVIGIQTSALGIGGYTGGASAACEKFNGSSWTTTGSLNTARYRPTGTGGSNTAASV